MRSANGTVLRGVARAPQTSKMESFAVIANTYMPLTAAAKLSILYIHGDPDNASGVQGIQIEYQLGLVPLKSKIITQPAITCSKLTIETLEQDVKYVRS